MRCDLQDRGTPLAWRGGFSIIELLVVVTLVLALTSIIAPTFRLTPTRQVENMAHQIVAHLELARTEALGTRRLVRVDFDVANDRYVAYADHDEDGVINAAVAEIDAFPEFGVRSLEGLVTFGRGTAAALAGDAGTDQVTLAGGRLSLDNQGIPTPWGTMGVIYLTHVEDNSAVSAVSVASSGAFTAWRWWADTGEWR